MIAAKDNDKIDPSFRIYVACVPIKYYSAFGYSGLQFIDKLDKCIQVVPIEKEGLARLTLSSSTTYDCHASSKPSWRLRCFTSSPTFICFKGTGDSSSSRLA